MDPSDYSSPSPSYPTFPAMPRLPSPITTISPTHPNMNAASPTNRRHNHHDNNLELQAARQRLETAKKWEANATSILETAQKDTHNARSELSDAAAYLKFVQKKMNTPATTATTNVTTYHDSCSANVTSEMSEAAACLRAAEEKLGITASGEIDDDASCAASVVSRLAADIPWNPALTVTGSSVPEIDGKYSQLGYFDEVPKYVKMSENSGKREVMMVYRCKVSETARRWYISVGTPENAIFFVGAKEGCRKPPVKGWVNIASRGTEKRLKVYSNL